MESNKEIFVTALSVLLIFLCGYTVNIQEHRAVIKDIQNTLKQSELEKYQYRKIIEKFNRDCTSEVDKK